MKKVKKKNKRRCGDVVPQDLLIYEILPHLPVKSLCRFKSVCKKWNNVITHDQVFIHAHSRKGPNPTNFTGSSFFCARREYLISSDPCHHQLNLSKPRGCNRNVNGAISGFLYGHRSTRNQIYIYNPVTKEEPTIISNPNYYSRIMVAYDPYNNPSAGFAVVALVSVKKDLNRCGVKVYSSKTHEWRASKAEFEIPSDRLLRRCTDVFCKGKVFWSVVDQIIWFDIEDDVAGFIQCPNNENLVFIENKEPAFQDVGVCNGKGGELSYTMLTKEGNIEIWLLEGDVQKKFEWERRYVVGLLEIVQRNSKLMKRYFSYVEVWNRDDFVKSLVCRRPRIIPVQYMGGEVIWFLIDYEGYDVMCSFNMSTQEFEVISDDLPLPWYPFIPTFLSCPK